MPLPYDPRPGPTGEAPQDRPSRAGTVLAIGVALLLLAVGGLTYALLRNQGGDKDPGGGATSSAPVTTSPTTPSPAPTRTTATPSSPPTTRTTPPPAQTVLVHVRALRAGYSGACPPPEASAPAFAGVLTVGRTPVSVEYRWVTESGESSATDWQTLEFAADGPREKEVEHIELTYRADETRRDRIRLEVRAPVEKRSNWVPFSVTCEQATPTGGVTSPSGSATPQP
ncbi:hypothetical protein ACFVZW_36250 [Streptomyces sp. NPDC059567]|uniref:hypothetical protein n=1 Tax=Streptomyces sp. NPDC059567 TaxID=3346867 RepID=UPI003676CB79